MVETAKIPTEGWARLGSSFIFHFCRLSDFVGCGTYRATCGVKGWIQTVVTIDAALPWCNRCVQILDQEGLREPDLILRPSTDLPPGQVLAKRWPILHLGDTPKKSGDTLLIDGLCSNPRSWTIGELTGLPQAIISADMHCIMRWTVRSLIWSGVSISTLIQQVKPQGMYVMVYAENDYAVNLHISDFAQGILALTVDEEKITPEHGGPLRLVVPHLYAWKSPKWVKHIEFIAENAPGTWEQRGLHMHGDPWKEERFAPKKEEA